MNLIRGVRSAWAAACRRARVANMATAGLVVVVLGGRGCRVWSSGGVGGRSARAGR